MSASPYDPVFIERWLSELALSEYIGAFLTNHIDAEVLPLLTEEDLREIGVASVGHRKRLLQTIGQLKSAAVHGSVEPTLSAVEEGHSATTTPAPPVPVSGDNLSRAEAQSAVRPMKLFLSYGRDGYVQEVLALKQALEARGHEVWFDQEQLGLGLDWEQRIEAGLVWCDRVVLTMTPHSVRRPDGYCLNELAKALERQKTIIPVLLSDVPNGAPTSICRIQYLDWRDAIPSAEKPDRFAIRMARLCEAIEQDKLDFEGGQQRLIRALQPLNYAGDIDRHIGRFTGRDALFQRLRKWLDDPSGAQTVWLSARSGVGKSAVAAMLSHRWGHAGAIHFCVAGHADKSDPRRAILSIAFQLSTKIDLYRTRLMTLDLERETEKDPRALFDALLVAPLSGDFPHPGHAWMVIVDGLDEANSADGRNDLAELFGFEWSKLPNWIRLVVTAQPEGELLTWLADSEVIPIESEDPDHRADLRSFIEHDLVRQGKPVSSEILDRIVDRSEGAFQYAVLLLEEVRQGRIDPRNALQLPRGMQAAYFQTFKRRFPDIAVYRDQFRPLLDLVVASPDPVPLQVLAGACQISTLEARHRVSTFGTMMAIQAADAGQQPEWDMVRLAQASLREWLISVDERTRQPVSGAFALDLHSGARSLGVELVRLWDRRDRDEHSPVPFIARSMLSVLQSAGLKAELERVAPDLARYWEKRSLSRAYPVVEIAISWAHSVDANEDADLADLRQAAGSFLVGGRIMAARGDSVGGLQLLRQSLSLHERLLEISQSDFQAREGLAQAHIAVAKVLRDQGDLPSALSQQQEALGILERLHADDSERRDILQLFASGLNTLGNLQRAAGENDQALEAYLRSRALRQALVQLEPSNRDFRRDLGGSFNNIGIVLKAQGDLTGALREYSKFRDIAQTLHLDEPQSAEWRRVLSISHHNTSLVYETIGQTNDALHEALRSLALRQSLVLDEPDHIQYRQSLGDAHGRVANLLKAEGKLDEALAHYEQDLAMSQALVTQDPSNMGSQAELAGVLSQIASVHEARGHLDAALSELGRSLEIREHLVLRSPLNAAWQRSLGVSLNRMSRLLSEMGDADQALALALRSLEIRKTLAIKSPQNAARKEDVAVGHRTLADLLQRVSRLDEALEHCNLAVEISRVLVAQDERNADWQEAYASSLLRQGSLLTALRQTDQARESLTLALSTMTALLNKNLQNAAWQDLLSDVHREVGWLNEAVGRWTEALEAHREDLRISSAIGENPSAKLGWRRDVGLAHFNVGWVLLRQGHHREALENLEKALEILEAIQQSERSGEAVERAAAAWLRHEALCALGEQDQSLDMSAVLDEINWKAAPVDSPLRFRLVSLLLTASTS